MPVNIHGKQYITVAERVDMAKDMIKEIYTEVLQFEPKVVVRATVTLKDGRKATGISAANVDKVLEKQSPFEIAETSALGRSLGFLSFGSVEGIATADEMVKAEADPTDDWKQSNDWKQAEDKAKKEFEVPLGLCAKCGAPNIIYKTSGKIGCSKLCWKNK